jgi:ribosomal protein S18 acetylase RimI-like enzyme
MTDDIVVRSIQDEDIDQVISLWGAAGLIRPWNDPVKDIGFARRDLHSTVLVADRRGRVIATAMVGEDGHRGWLYYVAASPEFQGNGFGRLIMAAAEAWLSERGVWKVQLLIREDNERVREFYEHLGYHDTRTSCFQKSIAPQ